MKNNKYRQQKIKSMALFDVSLTKQAAQHTRCRDIRVDLGYTWQREKGVQSDPQDSGSAQQMSVRIALVQSARPAYQQPAPLLAYFLLQHPWGEGRDGVRGGTH